MADLHRRRIFHSFEQRFKLSALVGKFQFGRFSDHVIRIAQATDVLPDFRNEVTGPAARECQRFDFGNFNFPIDQIAILGNGYPIDG